MRFVPCKANQASIGTRTVSELGYSTGRLSRREALHRQECAGDDVLDYCSRLIELCRHPGALKSKKCKGKGKGRSRDKCTDKGKHEHEDLISEEEYERRAKWGAMALAQCSATTNAQGVRNVDFQLFLDKMAVQAIDACDFQPDEFE